MLCNISQFMVMVVYSQYSIKRMVFRNENDQKLPFNDTKNKLILLQNGDVYLIVEIKVRFAIPYIEWL